jgi:hypothetical protein
MLPETAVLPLILFMALLLVCTLCGLAASGHFPAEHRSPALKSGVGPFVLYGSLIVAVLCFGFGTMLAWDAIPWYAAVIGGGAMVLAAPLALRAFPDSFVNGRGVLVALSGVNVVIVAIWALAGR